MFGFLFKKAVEDKCYYIPTIIDFELYVIIYQR